MLLACVFPNKDEEHRQIKRGEKQRGSLIHFPLIIYILWHSSRAAATPFSPHFLHCFVHTTSCSEFLNQTKVLTGCRLCAVACLAQAVEAADPTDVPELLNIPAGPLHGKIFQHAVSVLHLHSRELRLPASSECSACSTEAHLCHTAKRKRYLNN